MGPNLLAGEPGFEPRLPDPESGVLPLDDSPLLVAPEHDKRAWLRCQVEGVMLKFSLNEPEKSGLELGTYLRSIYSMAMME